MRPRIDVKFIDLSGLHAMLLLAGVDVPSDLACLGREVQPGLCGGKRPSRQGSG